MGGFYMFLYPLNRLELMPATQRVCCIYPKTLLSILPHSTPAPKTHLRIIIHNIKLLVGHWSTGFFEPSH